MTTDERIWLVSYTLSRSAQPPEEQIGWCWTRPDPSSRGERDRNWHKLRRVSRGRERPGVYGDGLHLAEAKAAVETVVGPCAWPDLTVTQLWVHRRIFIDGQEGRVNAFAIGIPVGSKTAQGAAGMRGEIPESDGFVHVLVRSPAFPHGREFRFPKGHVIATAAHVAARKLMYQGEHPTFKTEQRVVLDPSLTLESAGVRDRDALEVVDVASAR